VIPQRLHATPAVRPNANQAEGKPFNFMRLPEGAEHNKLLEFPTAYKLKKNMGFPFVFLSVCEFFSEPSPQH
jgi:hypothetical protein